MVGQVFDLGQPARQDIFLHQLLVMRTGNALSWTRGTAKSVQVGAIEGSVSTREPLRELKLSLVYDIDTVGARTLGVDSLTSSKLNLGEELSEFEHLLPRL